MSSPTRSMRRHIVLAVVAAAAAVPFVTALGGATASAATLEPCDIYAAGGTPCVAAHSTTRALYADYDGALYQVRRASDGATTDIGVTGPGGIAKSGGQDAFCSGTTCQITEIYDQTGRGNALHGGARGYWSGPQADGSDNLADATAAPALLGGSKVYGVYVAPGTGYRNNATNGVATGDDPEGMYAVLDGTHYNGGCCFDYGNAETSGNDDGNGTMEALYFGTDGGWGRGSGTGPWIMADLENGLFSGQNPGENDANTGMRARFTTAFLKGGHNQWALRGGDAQTGSTQTFFAGARPTVGGYDPMSKQGAIVLGVGGDNSPTAAGTFYEGVMTAGYPTDDTENAVQANIAAHAYMPVYVPLQPGNRISLQTTTSSSDYVEHDHDDEAVSVDALSGSSPAADRGRATFVETAGLANSSCVSFEAADEPGSYLRHAGFVLRIEQNDNSSLYANDATFCPTSGNSGTGTSFRSVNFSDRYLRAYQGQMYLASNGGGDFFDDTSNWAADTSFTVAAPLS